MQGNSFNTFRFTVYEVIAGMISLATMAVGITLWSMSTFQTKEASLDQKQAIERRLDLMETKVTQLNQVINQVATDVSYIRGRMEPK